MLVQVRVDVRVRVRVRVRVCECLRRVEDDIVTISNAIQTISVLIVLKKGFHEWSRNGVLMSTSSFR